jgi:hypothetical protein
MISIDPYALIIFTINFLATIWLFNRILYKPIRQILPKRKQAFNKDAEAAIQKHVSDEDQTKLVHEYLEKVVAS